MTKELRQEGAKKAKELAENAKNAVRAERRDALKEVKKAEGVSNDEKKRWEKQVEQATEAAVKRVEQMLEDKVREFN